MQFPAALFAIGLLGGAVQKHDAELTVNTTSGRYTGFIDTRSGPDGTPDVNQWLGIRYGQPPLGKRRFLPPLAAEDDGLHRYAREYPTLCLQQSGDHTGLFWELVPEFQNQDPQGEDCLFLNVWAPRKPVAKKVPVIIWVCGGGLQEGGGHAPYQVPDQWVQRMQTHIVVTFNYRLNVFGFPGAKGAMENAGYLDARLVVEWAKDNIEVFGGDPERMVIWGQSAGAGLVTSYVYANGEDPIVTGAIANSGSIGGRPRDSDTENKFSQVAEIAGCGGLKAEEELACMQEVPALRLQSIVQSGGEDIPMFGAAVDNVTVFSNSTERLERGLVAKIPLMTGTTSNEAAAFGDSFNKSQTTPPPQPPGTPPGFSPMDCGLRAELKDRLKYGHTSYRYLFAGNFSNITPRYWLGAMHSSDLPVIFGTHYQFRGNSTELEWQTSYAMEDLWVAFATDSSKDPSTSNGLTWPKYSIDGETVVLFGNGTEAAQLAPVSVADISDCPDGGS